MEFPAQVEYLLSITLHGKAVHKDRATSRNSFFVLPMQQKGRLI
jgi:hypothetical protein